MEIGRFVRLRPRFNAANATSTLALAAAAAGLSACRVGQSEPGVQLQSEAVTTALGDPDRDLGAYAALCKQELGIPDVSLPDLNCLNGVEVPITVNQQPLTEAVFARLAREEIGCDRAQWLDGKCWTYDLVQRVRIEGHDEIEGVLNCRQKLFTSHLSPRQRIDAYNQAVAANAPAAERLRLWRLIYEFDDLGLILRNRNTGKSCFFTFFGALDLADVSRTDSYYGGYIPAPDRQDVPSRDDLYARLPEPKPPGDYPDRMWHRGPLGYRESDGSYVRNMFFDPSTTAGGGCVSCHSQGAFKHSPFIDQARDNIGRIVPRNPADLPYLPVGPVFQRQFRASRVIQVDTVDLATTPGGQPRGQVCTTCHAMAAGGRGALERAAWAVGRDVPAMSEAHGDWRLRAWMRPNHGKATQGEFDSGFKRHIDALLCCMRTPDARGCRKRVFGPTAADLRLESGATTLSDTGWVEAPESAAVSCLPE